MSKFDCVGSVRIECVNMATVLFEVAIFGDSGALGIPGLAANHRCAWHTPATAVNPSAATSL